MAGCSPVTGTSAERLVDAALADPGRAGKPGRDPRDWSALMQIRAVIVVSHRQVLDIPDSSRLTCGKASCTASSASPWSPSIW
jgi:hypothetical protein